MMTLATPANGLRKTSSEAVSHKRLMSIDLLRGLVMIIMCLDHTRDYFHKDAFLYSPEDLSQTTVPLFLTRWVTHYCAPVFVFLAGISAYLSGTKKSAKELRFYLWTRGLWLIFLELLIVSLFRSFNPTYPYFNLQVIWAIGVNMIVLAAFVNASRTWTLAVALILSAGHNLLDAIHVPGNRLAALSWSLLHEQGRFTAGRFTLFVTYPLIPWIGIMLLGYCFGPMYLPTVTHQRRKNTLLALGIGGTFLFLLLRSGNFYGDAAHWSAQKDTVFSVLSFLNVSKYPPSLQYILVTLGPACIFLALSERFTNKLADTIAVFGRAPMFYYLAHILLIHLFAFGGAVICGYRWQDMLLLPTTINRYPLLKGYGFSLTATYFVWAGLVVILYFLCRWYGRYKKENLSRYPWLSYL